MNNNNNQQSAADKLLYKQCDIFSETPPVSNVYEHTIIVKRWIEVCSENLSGIHSQQRVDCEIQSMLENNIIKRSESNFINTLVIVKKKNDDIRLSVDYEKFK